MEDAEPSAFDTRFFEQPGPVLFEALADHWAAADTDFYERGRDAAAVEAIERRHGLHLPEDFRAYLLHAAPRRFYWGDAGIGWWAADELKTIPEECGKHAEFYSQAIEDECDRYLVFSDFLDRCNLWAVCCSDSPDRGRIISASGGGTGGFVADSFRDFVALALEDSSVIHRPGSTGRPG